MVLAVLPHLVGPITATAERSPWRAGRSQAREAERSSVATRAEPTLPRIMRPGTGPRTINGFRSWRRASRDRVSTPSRRRLSVPTR